MMDNMENNSFVRKENSDSRPSFENRKKDLQQFQNVKVVKKDEVEHPILDWFMKMFFSGKSFKTILLEATENKLVPAIKDGFRNGVVDIIDEAIFDNHKSTSKFTSSSDSFVTNYVSFSTPSASSQSNSSSKAREENKRKEEETIKKGYECPVFKSKADANNFIMSMHAYVNKYETLSVCDLSYMRGKNVNYSWDRWGWNRAEILSITEPAHISHPEYSWMIDLPPAHEIL